MIRVRTAGTSCVKSCSTRDDGARSRGGPSRGRDRLLRDRQPHSERADISATSTLSATCRRTPLRCTVSRPIPQGQTALRRHRGRDAGVHRRRAAGGSQCVLRPWLSQCRAWARGQTAGGTRADDRYAAACTAPPPAGPNRLDDLCVRYGIDNADRTKHGALLDAELLARSIWNCSVEAGVAGSGRDRPCVQVRARRRCARAAEPEPLRRASRTPSARRTRPSSRRSAPRRSGSIIRKLPAELRQPSRRRRRSWLLARPAQRSRC